MNSGKILFSALGLMAVLLLSATAFATTLNEGDSIKVTGAGVYAGDTLELKFTSTTGASDSLRAFFELRGNIDKAVGGETHGVIKGTDVPLNEKINAYFSDPNGNAYFKERIVITSITAAKYDGNVIVSPATLEFVEELEAHNLITPNFGEEFTMNVGDTAKIYSDGLTLVLDKVLVNSDGSLLAYVSFEKSDGSIGQGTQFSLSEGQSGEAFGYSVKATRITHNVDTANFVISRVGAIPVEAIKAGLGEPFQLVLGQVAYVYKKAESNVVLGMQLDQVVKVDTGIRCITTPCPSTTYYAIGRASVNPMSGTAGALQYFKIRLEDSQLIENYKLSFLGYDETSSTAKFAVHEVSGTSTAVVYALDEPFALQEGQKAESGQAPLVLELVKARQGIAIVNAMVYSGPEGPGQGVTGKTLYLKEGSQDEAFGYFVKLHGISYAIEGANSAKLTVSKSGAETTKVVYLYQNFRLQQGEKASVARQAEGKELFQIKLESIAYATCRANEECDSSPVAHISLLRCSYDSDSDGGTGACTGTELFVAKGDKVQFGEFYVYFVEADGSTGVFFAKEIEGITPIRLVNLDEKFTLNLKDIAEVSGEGAFIQLLGVEKTAEGKLIAGVDIWSSSSGTTSPQPPASTTSSPSEQKLHRIYTLSPGESIELYGLSFTATDVEILADNSRQANATFIVTKTGSSVKNVHVGEEFKLMEREAARVLEANIRIDLLSINYSIPMEGSVTAAESGFGSSNSPSTSPTVEAVPTATFSVSNYLFGASSIGKTVSQAVVEQVVTSPAAEGQATLPVTGKVTESDLPPMPFDTYTLGAGESVTVNEFTIKLVDLTPRVAYFIVTSKSTGYTVKMEFSRGWNLFSMPGTLEGVKTDCKTSDWKIFRYDAYSKTFERTTEARPGEAYWVYNPGEKCTATGEFRDPYSMDTIGGLAKGWNFIPITLDMLKKKPSELSESCKLRGAYFFNANSKKWEKASTRQISESDLGKGMAVYATEACSLGETTPPIPSEPAEPSPPTRECSDEECMADAINSNLRACTPVRAVLSSGEGKISYYLGGKKTGSDGAQYCVFGMRVLSASGSMAAMEGKSLECNLPSELTKSTIEKAFSDSSSWQRYCSGELLFYMSTTAKVASQPLERPRQAGTTGGN